MKNLRTLGIAGALVAAGLVGGTLISAVAASPRASAPPGTDSTLTNTANLASYCTTWQHTFAAQLGVSVDKLHVTQAPRDQQASNDDNRQQGGSDNPSARQEQQRREILQRMWRRLTNGSDPLDMVA